MQCSDDKTNILIYNFKIPKLKVKVLYLSIKRNVLRLNTKFRNNNTKYIYNNYFLNYKTKF